jgi:cell division transport system permease protein
VKAFVSKARYFGRAAAHGMRHSPFVHVVAISTIAIALFAAGLARSATRTLDSLIASLGGEVELTVYVDPLAPAERVNALVREVQARSQGTAKLVSPEDAMKRLSSELGPLGQVLADLPENPLPLSIEVEVPAERRDPAVLRAASIELRRLPGVTGVDYGEEAVARLSAIARALKFGGLVAFVIVLVTTVVIVGATLQLAIYARREEIEIQKLVGATNRFVKAPFLIEGLVQGLAGALVATGALWFFASRVGPRFSELFGFLVGGTRAFELLSPRSVGELMALGCLLGLTGSFIAVGRFLRV